MKYTKHVEKIKEVFLNSLYGSGISELNYRTLVEFVNDITREIRLLSESKDRWMHSCIENQLKLESAEDDIRRLTAALELEIDSRQKAEIDADFYKGEVKLRNRIPPTNDAAASLLKQVHELREELAASRAKVAAAYEAAADAAFKAPAPEIEPEAEWLMEHQRENSYNSIRALTPTDAQSALNKMLTEARLEGWKDGRDAAAQVAEDKCTKRSQYALAQSCKDAIRAMPDPKGDGYV